ncbi:hypothetical protein [Georgenia muralis]
MGRRSVAPWVSAVVVTALVACSPAADGDADGRSSEPASSTPSSGPSVVRAAGTTALISAEVDSVMDALLSGVVVRTNSGCLALEDPAGELPVLWPHGTTVSADGRSVEVPGFGRVTVGDMVWSGGGFTTGEQIAPPLPEECTPPAGASLAALQDIMDGPPPY